MGTYMCAGAALPKTSSALGTEFISCAPWMEMQEGLEVRPEQEGVWWQVGREMCFLSVLKCK